MLHGGPATLLGAAGADALRAAGAYSLLETTASQGWHLAVALERALAAARAAARRLARAQPSARSRARCAAIRTTRPRSSGSRGSPLRLVYGALPELLRRDVLRSLRTELTVAAAFGGPPSVAHAEALLRAVELRRAELDGRSTRS